MTETNLAPGRAGRRGGLARAGGARAEGRAMVAPGRQDRRRHSDRAALSRTGHAHGDRMMSGMPGAAPFVRGARRGAWLIRQAFAHPDPERTNDEILADLAGGVGGDRTGDRSDGQARRRRSRARAISISCSRASSSKRAGVARRGAPRLGRRRRRISARQAQGRRCARHRLQPRSDRRADAHGRSAARREGVRARTCSLSRDDGDLPTRVSCASMRAPVHEAGGTEAQEIADGAVQRHRISALDRDKELNVERHGAG